ncbi:MAG TPA: carbohydrate ABC transporter permease [Roseiflexaceae bacterium]|nr:carbohydrate ABC transporter permease [Roseiflexaceae bacterium]
MAANIPMRERNNLIKGIGFWLALGLALLFFLFPLYWMLVTSVKARAEVTLLPPTFVPFVDFTPTGVNYLAVFTRVSELGGALVQGEERQAELSDFPLHLFNSVVIAGGSTVLSVVLGTLAAYAFSRFRIRGEADLLFFILSTRMLPPIVVLIPIFLMFTWAGLRESYLGITLLYITTGLPFVVWMMKGFFDEIPREYEEAAMTDGYSRLEAIWKIVLPEALPAMLATAVFVLITSWNEFVFVQLLNPSTGTTVPPFLLAIVGYGQIEWGRMAATSVVFLLPVVIFTFLVRHHLLRGVTFGAVRR